MDVKSPFPLPPHFYKNISHATVPPSIPKEYELFGSKVPSLFKDLPAEKETTEFPLTIMMDIIDKMVNDSLAPDTSHLRKVLLEIQQKHNIIFKI